MDGPPASFRAGPASGSVASMSPLLSPFLRPDSLGLADRLADAAIGVLSTRAADGLTVASLAEELGVTRQALSQLRAEPPVPALPRTDDELAGCRAWLTVLDLARDEMVAGNSDLREGIERIRDDERESLAWRLSESAGRILADDAVLEVFALTHGLRALLCLAAALGGTAEAADDAHRVLAARIDALTGDLA